MSLPIRPRLSKLELCHHGGIDFSELKKLGISPGAIIDFSVNSNPFGPPPGVKKALTEVAVDCYPDSESSELKQVLSVKLEVAEGNILVGNGSIELLRLLALTYLNNQDLVIIPQPTFGEYEFACRLVKARLLKPWAEKRQNFRTRADNLADLIKKHHPKAVFLGNPNNPTGQYFSKEEVEQIINMAKDSLVVIDEAYVNFVDDGWSAVDLIKKSNLLLLRSMTKDYALAGLRLGYAIAEESIILNLRQLQPPWNVNAVAQKAGLVAVMADGYLKECQAKLRQAKNFLIAGLASLGLPPLPSEANFFLVEVEEAGEFRRILLERGILVRDCTSFGLPNHIRLAVRTLPECQKLVQAIKESGVLQKCRQRP